ncbi:DNA damage-inducible protein 1 [Coemansia sp. RSA 552]|nr:DNA damage-inducible protein 1 [Coemansia sp. RSA 552]
MQLTIMHGDDSFTLEVDESMELGDLSALLEMECKVPVANQLLTHNGRPISDAKKSLGALGIKTSDAVCVNDKTQQAPKGGSGGQGTAAGLSPQVEAHRQQVLGNPQLMAQLAQTHPEIAEAARNSPAEFERLLQQLRSQQEDAQRQRQQEMERLHADPFDVEAQQRIEETIRQENIMRNMELALEHNPESFASVTMLYIDVIVNGTPVKALVDSGAQATVMSYSCAEQCGIMRLVDKRFSGEARGVGKAKILGRVHNAQLRLGNQVLMCSFTVMDGAHINLLFGLDMLKRHLMCIDLKQNALVIGDENIPFLPEHLIPKEMDGAAAPMAAPPSAASSSAAATPTSATPATSQSQQPQLPPRFGDEAIQTIMNLGVGRDEAIRFLEQANGNVELAASLLFS